MFNKSEIPLNQSESLPPAGGEVGGAYKHMKKIFISFITIACIFTNIFANENDSLKTIHLQQVNISTYKETNHQNAPVSSSLLNAAKIEQSQINSIKDLSGKIPNFFIPDYGSSLSNAVYIRGIGSRNSGQSVSLYLDNVPYLDKTAFDFEFYDLAQIEVMRGSQGALYGRNAMGGIVNIYTLSPLNYQGTRAAINYGNYGYMQGKLSHYAKLNEKLGISLSGFYNQHNGFYFNDYTQKNVDDEKSAGGRFKMDWNAAQNLKVQYVTDFDYIKQGAFPYGLYNATTNTTANPNFNGVSNYTRKTLNNSITTNYSTNYFSLLASLSHQYFNDQMNMDQDFTSKSIFSVQQNQKQNMLNGELILKSIPAKNYNWLVGANAFGQKLDLYVPVSFEKDGIPMLQSKFPPSMTLTNTSFDIPGWYNNKRSGAALFHQSTISNILLNGLSLTLGIRLDYEKVALDYNTNASLDINMKQGQQAVPMHVATDLNGSVDTTFVELLPKGALKYEWKNQNYIYISASRGYKTGGFNVQMISDLVSQKLMASMAPNAKEPDVKRNTLYLPELSWNYELGIHTTFLDDKIKTGLTVFMMDISGLQLTEFIASGAGRKLTNAGTSTSKGIELSANMLLGSGFDLDLNYGYAKATFKHYTTIVTVNDKSSEVNYSGNYIPYAPQNTVSANVNYSKVLKNSIIDRIYGTVSYNGIGKIYWTEANDISENYYNIVNAKIGAKKGIFGLELWGQNLFNTEYNAFYFKSFGNTFFQKGKPLQFGVKLALDI